MFFRFLFLFLFSFCFSSKIIYKIDNKEFSEASFFSMISKEEWSSLSNQQQKDFFRDYIYKNIVFLESKNVGFFSDPYFSRKLKNRIDQFLINVAYDFFVAYPLVDSSSFNNNFKYLSQEISVSHLLLGYNGCRLPVPINRSKQNTAIYSENIYSEIVSGNSFDKYVIQYSDDPSVDKNGGALGWLSWGRTVPEFQRVAFSLTVGEISPPVLTDFGYHIIRLDDRRPSQFSFLDSLDYYALCVERAIAAVPLDVKRLAAKAYDDSVVLSGGLVFNSHVLLNVYNQIVKENNKNRIVASGKKNLIKILYSLDNFGVVCVFNGDGYGLRWFADHFSRLPATRIPSINSLDDLRRSFKLAVLQQLSLNKINSEFADFSFLLDSKIEKISKNLVFDSYIKFFINNLDDISDDAVINYYEKNKKEKYVEFDLVEVREIKTLEKALSDSLFFLLSSGESFEKLAHSFSLTNPRGGGLIDPFTKGRYGPMGLASFLLEPGSFSNQIENLDGTWSIVFLENKIDENFIPLSRVKTKIKSLLKKNLQSDSKNLLYQQLYEKYSVWVSPSFFEKKTK